MDHPELSNNSIAALVRAAGLMSAWPVTGSTVRLGGAHVAVNRRWE